MSIWRKLQIAVGFVLLAAGIFFLAYSLGTEKEERKIVPFRNEVESAIKVQDLPYTVKEKDENEFKKAKKEGTVLVAENLKVFLHEVELHAEGSIINKTFIGREWVVDSYRLPRHLYWTKVKDWKGAIGYEIEYDPPELASFSPKVKGYFVGTTQDGVIFEYRKFSFALFLSGVFLLLGSFMVLSRCISTRWDRNLLDIKI